MSPAFVVLFMLFMHVLDDFVLQSVGFLNKGKVRQWWKENAPDSIYRFDYMPCLVMHAISWTFMVMLPIAMYHNFDIGSAFVTTFVLNAITHALVDHMKANERSINLIIDQSIHILQIAVIAMVYLV